MKRWYAIEYSSERAFKYMEKCEQVSIGVQFLEMRYVSQKSIQRIF